MIGLIQGVTRASVEIDLQQVASINFGMLLMIGFFRCDERNQIERFVDRAQTKFSVEAGVFGAHMEVHSVNDGPCSFILTG